MCLEKFNQVVIIARLEEKKSMIINNNRALVCAINFESFGLKSLSWVFPVTCSHYHLCYFIYLRSHQWLFICERIPSRSEIFFVECLYELIWRRPVSFWPLFFLSLTVGLAACSWINIPKCIHVPSETSVVAEQVDKSGGKTVVEVLVLPQTSQAIVWAERLRYA